jgi:hypothetical protein
MYKSILVILLVGLFAAPAMAQVPEPPAEPGGNLPGGWGNNPNNWSHVTDEFCPVTKGVWDPETDEWVICEGGNTMCQMVVVELWIELFASMTMFNMFHEIHTISDVRDYREYCGYILGYTSANHELDIVVTPGPGQSLGFLTFMHSVIDGQGDYQDYPQNGRDIALDWYLACDQLGLGQQPPAPDQANYNFIGGGRDFDVDQSYVMECIESPCDWYWYFKFCFRVYYHEDDGYYVLDFKFCPYPVI